MISPVEKMPGTGPIRMRYAGFWVRFVADLIDSTGLTVLSFVLEALVLGLFYLVLRMLQGDSIPGIWDAFDPFMVQVLNMGLYFCLCFTKYCLANRNFSF